MKDEALDLALEALEKISKTMYHIETPPVESLEEQMRRIADKAITAIKQARALDKMAENARELGLDYEPVGLIDRLTNPEDHYEFTDPKKANAVLMSLCQEAADALAAPVQEPVQEPDHPFCDCGQKPHEMHLGWCAHAKSKVEWAGVAQKARHRAYIEAEWLKLNPPAQPAPEQEPVACVACEGNPKWGNIPCAVCGTTPPAAQPAVPDALTSADIQEHIEYVAGWNDCRQAMLEMMK